MCNLKNFKLSIFFLIGLIVLSTESLTAQKNNRVVFVNSNSVNIRKSPDVNSKPYRTARKYEAYEVANINCSSDWTPVKYSYYDNNKDQNVTTVAYISSKYVTPLENSIISKELLNNKNLLLAADPANDVDGALSFNFDGNNFNADYRTFIISWVKGGGSGTADWAQMTGKWIEPGYLKVENSKRAYGMVNEEDNVVIYDKNKGLLYFGGLLWKVPQNNNLQSFIITPEFKEKIKNYDILYPFNNGLARVKSQGKWGYINMEGDLIIPLIYQDAREFSDNGLAAVLKNDKWGFINNIGETVIPFNWDGVDYIGDKSITMGGFMGFKDNNAIVISGNSYGVINDKGDYVFPLIQYQIWDYKNGYAILKDSNKDLFGVAGKNGKILIPINDPGEMCSPSFQFIGGKLIDPDCDIDYGPNIFSIIDLDGKKKREKIIDNNSEKVIDNNIEPIEDYSLGTKVVEGLFAFIEEGKAEVGFRDKKGKIILPAVFTLPLNEFGSIDNDYLSLNQGNIIGVTLNFEQDIDWKENPDVKSGYIDIKGNHTFTPQEIEKAKKAAVIRNKKRLENFIDPY